MKKYQLILISCFFINQIEAMYLWEYRQDGERSCCLFFNGVDVCNPYAACTRNAALDLTRIYDYIGRIMLIDKGSIFSYHKVLNQAQELIKHVLSTHSRVYYNFDVCRGAKFYHEVAEMVRAEAKSSKGSSSSTTTSATNEKQKNEDAVIAYLTKLGLARPMR
jgi:hypothetical protein